MATGHACNNEVGGYDVTALSRYVGPNTAVTSLRNEVGHNWKGVALTSPGCYFLTRERVIGGGRLPALTFILFAQRI
jgi:hypothetical protein